MLQYEKLVEEVRDLEIHFTERLDDGADGKELASIFNQIKSLPSIPSFSLFAP